MSKHAVNIARFDELTTGRLYEIMKARFNVFVAEQRCFYPDLDDIDYRSIHFYIADGPLVIAYARLFADGPREWHVGRMLTTRRRLGLGRAVMTAVIEEARQQGAQRLTMEAQTHAIGFYERMGFAVTSEVFEEAGMPHVKMEMQL